SRVGDCRRSRLMALGVLFKVCSLGYPLEIGGKHARRLGNHPKDTSGKLPRPRTVLVSEIGEEICPGWGMRFRRRTPQESAETPCAWRTVRRTGKSALLGLPVGANPCQHRGRLGVIDSLCL